MDIIDNSPVAGAGYSDEQINENLGVAPVKSAVTGYNPEDGTYTAPSKDFKYKQVKFQMEPTDTNDPELNRINARLNDANAAAYTDPRLNQYLHNFDPDYGGQPIGEPFRTGMSDFMAHEYGRVDYDDEAGPMLTEEQVKQNRDDQQWDVPAVLIQGIPRFATRTAMTIGSAAGGVVKSIADVFGGNKVIDEYISPEAFAGYNEKFVDWMKEKAPIYDNKDNEELAQQHPIYSMFCTGNGWAETMDMLGFTTGAIASAYLMGKLGRPAMAGLATLQLGQSASKFFSSNVSEDSDKYLQLGLSAAAVAGAGVAGAGKVFGSSMLNMIPNGVKNAVGVLSGGILASAAEAEVEATNAKNDFIKEKSAIIDGDVAKRKLLLQQDYEAGALENAKKKYDEEYNRLLVEYLASGMDENKAKVQAQVQAQVQASIAYEESLAGLGDQFAILEWDGVKAKNKIIETSTKAADITRLLNYAILSTSHVIQFGKLFKGGFKTNRTMGQLSMRAEAEEAAEAAYRSRLAAAATSAERAAVKAEKDKIKAQAMLAWARNNEGKLFNETGKLTSGDLYNIFIKNPMAEGMEEMLQANASNAGKGVSEWYVDDYYAQIKGIDAYHNAESAWLSGVKAAFNTWTTESAWSEFLAGALMGAVGAPWIRRTRRATAVDENGNTTGEIKNKWLSWLHWRPTFAGGIRGEYERAVKTRKDMQAFANRLNEAMTDEGVERLRKTLGAMAKSMQFREDMGIYADENNRFAFQNEADKDILNTIELYQNTGQLSLLRGMVESLDGMTDEELRAFRDMTTTIENNVAVGPYAEFQLRAPEQLTTDDLKRQNHDEAEKMRQKIRENIWKYTKTIDTYVKARRDLDFETNQAFTDEQLNCLTWYKTRIGMFDDRAANMYGKSKNFLGFVRAHIDEIIDAMRADHEKKVANATALMDQIAQKPEAALTDQEKMYYQELALEVQALNDFNANADYIKEAFIERYDKADNTDDDLAAVRLLFAGSKKNEPKASSWYGRLRRAITGRLNSSHRDWQKKNKAVNDFFDVLSDMMGDDIADSQTASTASQYANDQSGRKTIAEMLTDMKRCQDSALQFKDRFQFYKDNPQAIVIAEGFARARAEREEAQKAESELEEELRKVKSVKDVYDFVIKQLQKGTDPDDIEQALENQRQNTDRSAEDSVAGNKVVEFLHAQRFIAALKAALDKVVVTVNDDFKQQNMAKEFILAVAIECAKEDVSGNAVNDIDQGMQYRLIEAIKDKIYEVTASTNNLRVFLLEHKLVWGNFNVASLSNDNVTYFTEENGQKVEHKTGQSAIELFHDESIKILEAANGLISDANQEYILNAQGISMTEDERKESTRKVHVFMGDPAFFGVTALNKIISIGTKAPTETNGQQGSQYNGPQRKLNEIYEEAIKTGRYTRPNLDHSGWDFSRAKCRIVRDYLMDKYGSKLYESPDNLSDEEKSAQAVYKEAIKDIKDSFYHIYDIIEKDVITKLVEIGALTEDNVEDWENDDEKKKKVYTKLIQYYEDFSNPNVVGWLEGKDRKDARKMKAEYQAKLDELNRRSGNQGGNQGGNNGGNQGGQPGGGQGNDQQGGSNQGSNQGGNRRGNDKKKEQEELKKKLEARRKYLEGIAKQKGYKIPDEVTSGSAEFGLCTARIFRDVALGELENSPTSPDDMTEEQLLDNMILKQAMDDIEKYHKNNVPATYKEVLERAIDLRIVSRNDLQNAPLETYDKLITMLDEMVAEDDKRSHHKINREAREKIAQVRSEILVEYEKLYGAQDNQGEDDEEGEEPQPTGQPVEPQPEPQSSQGGESVGQQPDETQGQEPEEQQSRKPQEDEVFPDNVKAQMPVVFKEMVERILRKENKTIGEYANEFDYEDTRWSFADEIDVAIEEATTEEEKVKYRCLKQEVGNNPGVYVSLIRKMAREETYRQNQNRAQEEQTETQWQQPETQEQQPQAGQDETQGQPEEQGQTMPQEQPTTQPETQPATQPAQGETRQEQTKQEDDELSAEARKMRDKIIDRLINDGKITREDVSSTDPRKQRRVAYNVYGVATLEANYESDEEKEPISELVNYCTQKLDQYKNEVLDYTEEDMLDTYELKTDRSLKGKERKSICENLIEAIEGNYGSQNKIIVVKDANKEAVNKVLENLKAELAQIEGRSFQKEEDGEFISPVEEDENLLFDPDNETEEKQNSIVDAENEKLPIEEEDGSDGGSEDEDWRPSVAYFDTRERKQNKVLKYLGSIKAFAPFFNLLTRLKVFSCIDDVPPTSADYIKENDKVYFVVDKIMPGKDRSEMFGLTADEMSYNGAPYVWVCVKDSHGRFQVVGALNTGESALRRTGQAELYSEIMAAANKAQGVYVHNKVSRVTKVFEGFIHKTTMQNNVVDIARDGNPQLVLWQKIVIEEEDGKRRIEWKLIQRKVGEDNKASWAEGFITGEIDKTYKTGKNTPAANHNLHSGMVCIKIKNNRDGKYHLVACKQARYNDNGRNTVGYTDTWRKAELAIEGMAIARNKHDFQASWDELNSVLAMGAFGVHINRRVDNNGSYIAICKIKADRDGVPIIKGEKDGKTFYELTPIATIKLKGKEEDIIKALKRNIAAQNIPFRITADALREGFVTAPVEKGADTYKGGNIEFSRTLEENDEKATTGATQAAEQAQKPEQPKPEAKPEPTFVRPDYIETELFDGAVTLKADKNSDDVFINNKEVKNKVIAKKLADYVKGKVDNVAVVSSDNSLAFIEEGDGNDINISFIKVNSSPSIDIVTCPNNQDGSNLSKMKAVIERFDQRIKECNITVKKGEGDFLQRFVDTVNDDKFITKLRMDRPDDFDFRKFAERNITNQDFVNGKMPYFNLVRASLMAKFILDGRFDLSDRFCISGGVTVDDSRAANALDRKYNPNEGMQDCFKGEPFDGWLMGEKIECYMKREPFQSKTVTICSLAEDYRRGLKVREEQKEKERLAAQREAERLAQEEARKKAEAEEAKRRAEEAKQAQQRAEEARKAAEAEAKRQAEIAKKQKEEAERKAAEDQARKAAMEAEAKRKAEEEAKRQQEEAAKREQQAMEDQYQAEQRRFEEETKVVTSLYDESLSRDYENWQQQRQMAREKRRDETSLRGMSEQEQIDKREAMFEQDKKEVKNEIFVAATNLVGVKNEDFTSTDPRVRRNALRAVWREVNNLVDRDNVSYDEETGFAQSYSVKIAQEPEVIEAVRTSLKDSFFSLNRELVEDDLEGILESIRDMNDDWSFRTDAKRLKNDVLSEIDTNLKKRNISDESKAKLEALRAEIESQNENDVREKADDYYKKKILTPNSLESRQYLKDVDYDSGISPEQDLAETRVMYRRELMEKGVDVDQLTGRQQQPSPAQGRQVQPTQPAQGQETQSLTEDEKNKMWDVVVMIFERYRAKNIKDYNLGAYYTAITKEGLKRDLESAVADSLKGQISEEERALYELFKQTLQDETMLDIYMGLVQNYLEGKYNLGQEEQGEDGYNSADLEDADVGFDGGARHENSGDNIEEAMDGGSFSVVKESERRRPRVDFSKEIEALRTIDPSMTREDAISIIDGLIETGRKGVYAQGLFRDGHFIISRQAVRGTVFHEAFHKIFRTALTETKRRELLMDAKRVAGNEDMADYEAEELLCDWFRDYAVDRVYGKSWTQRIKDFFRALFHLRSIGYERLRDVTLDCFNATLGGRYGETFIYEDVKTSRINECFRRGMTPKQVSMAENRRSAYESRTAEEKAMLDSIGVTPEAFNMLSPKSREEMVRCL